MTAGELADGLGTLTTAGALALAVVGALALVARPSLTTLRHAIGPLALGLAAGVAGLATAASLWFSEVADFPPCSLCWYQRIAMYPLVPMLALAAVRRDRAVRPYALVVAGCGLVVNAWHNVVETFPDLDAGGCDMANPCTIRWVEGLGFWTIPRMATVAFGLIVVLLLLARTSEDQP